jgi:ABC-type transport system involved in cytochrome c biogenesis permease subunit
MKMRSAIPLLILLAAAAAYLGAGLLPLAPRDGYDLQAFARLPVTHDGRVKPIDSMARADLLVLSARQSVPTPDGGLPAIAWLLDVMAQKEPGKGYPVFRIDHPDLLGQLGLPADQRTRFAFGEFSDRVESLEAQVEQASQTPVNQRDNFQTALLDFAAKLNTYTGLRFADGYLPVAPQEPGAQWQTLAQAHAEAQSTGRPSATLAFFPRIVAAYTDQNPDAFNRAVDDYDHYLRDHLPQVRRRAAIESLYVRSDIFYRCTALYLLAFILVCASWLTGMGAGTGATGRPSPGDRCSDDQQHASPNPPARRTPIGTSLARWALALVLAAFAAHSLALAVRVYLHGRPPVTDLYSSAVFIGWVGVLLAAALELRFTHGIGTALAALIGTLTLIVAHNLVSGDTMHVMEAVLDTNFWLSTHVICITIGYATTFVAGILGIFYVLLGPIRPPALAQLRPDLTRMIYGCICFAMLFSFIGTVTGGIWADQSWGRFWGWDPKENGALLIVLWNALILHARSANMIRARGLAVLAVAGNIVTSWSWFGTNLLGIGLHSYGFMQGAMLWLLIFMAIQVLIIAIGLLPFAGESPGLRPEGPP